MNMPHHFLPEDEFNTKLAANVYPADWVNPEPSEKYNLVVIGAGTAGLVTAAGAAGLGAKVALIERQFMGGDCLNVGCVPSKAIISAARAAAAVSNTGKLEEFGVHVPVGTEIDFSKVMERMRKLRSDISPHDSVKRFAALGIDVFLGQGRFVDSSTIAVGDAKLQFAKAVSALVPELQHPRLTGWIPFPISPMKHFSRSPSFPNVSVLSARVPSAAKWHRPLPGSVRKSIWSNPPPVFLVKRIPMPRTSSKINSSTMV